MEYEGTDIILGNRYTTKEQVENGEEKDGKWRNRWNIKKQESGEAHTEKLLKMYLKYRWKVLTTNRGCLRAADGNS